LQTQKWSSKPVYPLLRLLEGFVGKNIFIFGLVKCSIERQRLNKVFKQIEMSTLSYKTLSIKPAEVNKQWIVIDAENQIVGRVATKAANILRGKHKPSYTPHVDCGDNVIIINAEKVKFTGKKLTDKQYVRHTGYPGGQRFATPQVWLSKFPIRVLEHAVKGMLPKNKLGAKIYKHLHVVEGPNHKFEAQKPQLIELNSIR